MKIFEVTEINSAKALNLIKKNCSKWLSDVKDGNYASRGIKSHDQFLRVKQPINRKPTATPEYIHDAFVDVFSELGFKANRDNSFFVFGNSRSEYGENSYRFYPIGDYDFTWSTKVRDLYLDMPPIHQIRTEVKPTKMIWKIGQNKDYDMEKIINEIEKNIGKPDLYKIIGKKREGHIIRYEIEHNNSLNLWNMISDYAVKNKLSGFHDDFTMENTFDSKSIDNTFLKEWVKSKDYKQDDINAALESRYEIMIACKAAYMVREDKVPEELRIK